MDKSNIINEILDEWAMHSPDGLIGGYNTPENIKTIVEILYDRGIDETLINEFVEEFMEEGKYPDRQAYNKDGWLVTFPSREYRDRAIKKGTHSISDPTHGKGGMNLYYKRKGKQKRQVQQAVTQTEKPQQKSTGAQPQAPASTTQPKKSERAPGELTPDMMGDEPEKVTSEPEKKQVEKPGEKAPQPSQAEPVSEPDSAQPQAAPADEPTDRSQKEPPPQPEKTLAPVSSAEPPKPDYEEISKKFVALKRWIPTPFGEYRDTQGNSVAVVGLSGEIVPIRDNDREEYKLFVEKNMPQQP